jgi:integrase
MTNNAKKNKMVNSIRYGSIVQLYHKANGDITYYACYEDPKKRDKNGKSIRIRLKIGSKSEGITEHYVKAKRDEIITQLRLGEIPEPIKRKRQRELFTFKSLAELYFEERLTKNGDSIESVNIKKDTSILNNHLTGFFKYGIEDISTDKIEKLKLEKTQKLAPKTVNNILIVLSAILNFGVRTGKLAAVPYIKKLNGIDNARQRYFTKIEIKQILEHVKTNWVLDLFVKLSLSTGGRFSTIRAIKIKDINLDAGMVLLTDLKGKAAGKNNSTYAGYFTRQLAEDLTRIIPGKERDAYLFSDEYGYRITVDYIKNNLQNLFNNLFNDGLDTRDTKNRAVIHTLRHTFASQLAIEGTPIFTIQKLMNHSDINMTMRYAKLSPDSGRAAVMGINIF